MSLNWSIRRVACHESVCYKGEGDKRELREATSAIIFLTMPVGINDITSKTVEEFCWRLEVLRMLEEAKYGPGACRSWPSAADVRAHIGLCTNASKMTEAKFMAYHGKSLRLIAQNRVKDASK